MCVPLAVGVFLSVGVLLGVFGVLVMLGVLGLASISVVVGVLSMFGMLSIFIVPGMNGVGLLDVDMEISKQVLREVVALRVTPGHKLVGDVADVPNDQRHRSTGGNPQRFGGERVLVQRDVDPQRLGLLRKR